MTETRTAYERRWQALALLAMTQFVVVLDAAIVNVALPSIGTALDFSQQNLQWVVNAYVLTFGGFLLLGGRAADLLGRRRMFMVGLVVFALASLAGGLANTEGQLIVARAVQGLGGAILAPAALSIVAATFTEGAERNKAMGVWGAVAGSGGAAGVLLGGILTDGLGWEWVFWVNVPIALAAAAIAPRVIAESRAHDMVRRFDVAGALSVTAGLTILVYALVDAEDAGWGSTQTVGLLALAVGLLSAFVVIESRSQQPLVPFRIFKLRALTAANGIMLIFGAGLFAMFFFVSLYMQQVLGFSPLEAGLAYLPLSAGIIVSAGVSSQLATRYGVRPVMIGGLVLVAIGLAWFSQVSPGGSFVSDVLGPSVVAAVGAGMVFVPVTISSVAGVAEQDSGLASGLINTSQQIGGALGLALLSTLANTRTDHLAGGGRPDASALTEGFQLAFLGGAGFAVVAAVFAFVVTPRIRATADGTAVMVEPAVDAT
jgi:EmrB/QacA subfamily drug resistance transporter